MAIDYDRSCLQRYADRLYSHATLTIIGYTFFGAAIGFIGGEFYGRTIHAEELGKFIAGAFAFVALLLGLRKAFWLKLEAQRTLCAMATEEHLEKIRVSLLDRQKVFSAAANSQTGVES